MCDRGAGVSIQLLGNAASHGIQHQGALPYKSRPRHRLGNPPISRPHPRTQHDEKGSRRAVAVERPCTIKVMDVTPLCTEFNPELFERAPKFNGRDDFLLHSELICFYC